MLNVATVFGQPNRSIARHGRMGVDLVIGEAGCALAQAPDTTGSSATFGSACVWLQYRTSLLVYKRYGSRQGVPTVFVQAEDVISKFVLLQTDSPRHREAAF